MARWFSLSRLREKVGKKSQTPAPSQPPPSFDEQVRALETFLGRPLPPAVARLFAPGSAAARHLMPLATGRENDDEPEGLAPEDRFRDATERLTSVLGHAMGRQDDSVRSDDEDEYVWPPGLLVIEDYGCAIYRAVDLDDPRLRVIEHEHFQETDDPEKAIRPGDRLAYAEPVVPRRLQHRFVVVADSLEDWVKTLPSAAAH